MISNWEDSPFDLRRTRLGLAGAAQQIVVSDLVAATLRDLPILDPDSERLAFRMRAHRQGAVLTATDEELDELIAFVAAQANLANPIAAFGNALGSAFMALEAARGPHGG